MCMALSYTNLILGCNGLPFQLNTCLGWALGEKKNVPPNLITFITVIVCFVKLFSNCKHLSLNHPLQFASLKDTASNVGNLNLPTCTAYNA